jgi:demethylmenaquinone methyltransferase/2-methoxy-6-polyprenyl-1,4-benzoquinol methylase
VVSDANDDTRIRDQIEFYRGLARLLPPVVDHGAEVGRDGLVRAYCPPSSRCLELASGTGRWTEPLLDVCERITAVDASPEMHAINRARNGDARVEYVEANLFEYRPDGRYDLIFAGFWLSHVPTARFPSFWSTLADALNPSGRVVMFDDGIRGSDGVARFADDLTGADANRRLPDGREFTIVKNAYAPSELEALLAELGWNAEVVPLTSVMYVVTAQH